MTNSELKKKIAESSEPEWFNNKSEIFDFPYINYKNEIVGVSAMYEFVNQQINGWGKKDNLPTELQQSLKYFENVKSSIQSFVNAYSQNTNNRNHYWTQQVSNKIRNTNTFPFVYNIPEVDFLIRLYNDTPNYFQGAFQTLVQNRIVNNNDKNYLYGSIQLYEFLVKDFTNITERRNSERRSILSIRNDFERYLSESEEVLSEHLTNSNNEFKDYVKLIDDLKTTKENDFDNWFTYVKDNEWKTWYENKINTLKNLEETYETKLKLEKPAEYWEKKAIKYYTQANTAKNYLIGIASFSIVFLSILLLTAPDWIFVNIFKGNEIKVVRWTLIFVVLISIFAFSIFAFSIRAFSKYMFSSYHLARDAEERHTLTFFYLALLKDTEVKDEERQMILQSLFSRSDTGLLKEDSSPTLPSSDIIGKIINK